MWIREHTPHCTTVVNAQLLTHLADQKGLLVDQLH